VDTRDAPRQSARADVRRNHERLLAAARDVFVRHGVDASLNEVARRAGVGPATLYRHFPTREALLEALLAGRYDELAATAHELRRESTPLDAITAWLRAFMAHVTTFRGLAAPVKTALHDERSALYSACHAMQAAWHELVAHAKESGAIRTDTDPADLLRLANAIAWSTEGVPGGPETPDRLLALALHGIVRQPGS
jgi:AcrR family transcriptional regulator